jgi:hypothetical protein
MKYLKMSIIFIALLVAGRTFGVTTPEIAMGRLHFVPATAIVNISLTKSDPDINLSTDDSDSQFEAVGTSRQTLKKKHTLAKFRTLAGTKRGKNRFFTKQKIEPPCRTNLIKILSPEELTGEISSFSSRFSIFSKMNSDYIFQRSLYYRAPLRENQFT